MKILSPRIPSELTTLSDVADLFISEDAFNEVVIEDDIIVGITTKHLTITESRIAKTTFVSSSLEKFETLDCEFKSCDFTAAKFVESSWHVSRIDSSRCSGTQFSNSHFKNVLFSNCKLEIVNFRFSGLESVVFDTCVMDDVDFNDAKLKNVEFVNCTINNISFMNARMFKVDISDSQIEGIKGASSLRGVTASYDQVMQLAPALAADAGIKIK